MAQMYQTKQSKQCINSNVNKKAFAKKCVCVCLCVYVCVSLSLSLSQTPPGLSPQASSIVHMCVSFSYKYLALLTDSGHVWMGTSNLKASETQQYHFVFYVYSGHRNLWSVV